MTSEEDDLLLGAEAKSVVHQNFKWNDSSTIRTNIKGLDMTGKAGKSAADGDNDDTAEDVDLDLEQESGLQTSLTHQESQNSENSVSLNSLDQILEERKGDPEMILQNLGFSGSYSGINCRIPDRFLVTPSNAYGISVEKFLEGNPKLREFLEEKNAIQNPFEMMMTTSAEGGQSDNLNSGHVQLLSHFQQLLSNLIVREVPLSYLASCAALIRGLPSTAVNDCICHTYCQIMRSRCGLQIQQNRKNETSSVRCADAGPATLVPSGPVALVPSDSAHVTLGPTASLQDPLQAAEVMASNDDILKQGFLFADWKIYHKPSDPLRNDNQLNNDLGNNDAQLNDYSRIDIRSRDDVENHAQPIDQMRNESLLNDCLPSDVHLTDPLRSDVVQNDFDGSGDWKSELWSGDRLVQNDSLEDDQWRVGAEDHVGSDPYGVLHCHGDERRLDVYTCRASCEFVKLYFGQRCLEVDEDGRAEDEAFDLQVDWCLPEVTLVSGDRGFHREDSHSRSKDSRCASVEFVDADDYCYIDDCVDWSTKNRIELNDEGRGVEARDGENREDEQSNTGGGYKELNSQSEDFCASDFKEGDDEYFYDDVVWPTESLV